jgi:N-sulfoglucosamine sulfohydrolase
MHARFCNSAYILMLMLGSWPVPTFGWAQRPNVLIAISDDQSFPHASAYGEPVIHTPAFDAVAKQGVLFRNAFTPAPGCSPMRAAILTGQYIWQIREAGTHASSFPKDLPCFPGELQQAGYAIGYTGKPWGPGNFKISGWEENPAGPGFNAEKKAAPNGISATDYATNFVNFLDANDEGKPFCFWYGGHEPHRAFGKGLGGKSGMSADDVNVPPFLPDSAEVRSDLLDYFYEIQWFDQHLGRMLAALQERGQLENTLVIVTSDNGMSFPRAKANLYEYGIHMPLAISWPAGQVAGGRVVDDLVNLIDVTATIYDACRVAPPGGHKLSGASLIPLLTGQRDLAWPVAVYSGRERHSSSRYNSLGYPCRCVRTKDYLYIRNYTPERWPAGTPRKYASARYDQQNQLVDFKWDREQGGYHDIDACPTLDWMIQHRDDAQVNRFLQLAVAIRPAEELFAIRSDPGCLTNLVARPEHFAELERHRQLLAAELERTGDLRHTDFAASHVWETYPRYSSLRWFPEPEWALQNPSLVPQQPWLDARRPRK